METNQIQTKPTNLGWENGWKVTPQIVVNCTHTIYYEKKSGYKIFSCPVCNYQYNSDSSD
jgi:hypothetical protein